MIIVNGVPIADGNEVFHPPAAVAKESTQAPVDKAPEIKSAEQHSPDPDSFDLSHFDK